MYIDGMEETLSEDTISGDSSFTSSDEPLFIGKRSDGYHFNGTIDEVRIYNRVLTAEEINASYNTGLYKLYHNFTGLADGTYTYTAYAQDIAGNVGSTETRTVTIDKIAPAIEFIPLTDTDNDYVNRNWSYVNVSVSDALSPNNLTSFIDWNNSLVGWWMFNEASGENSTFFRDWSSYGNNGSCTNCPGSTSGKFGKALEFDGVNDCINHSNPSSLQITETITVSAWVKYSTSQINRPIVSKWGTDQSYILAIDWVPSDKIVFSIRVSDVNKNASSSNTYNDGKWHFLTGVFNGSNVLLYIDGDDEIIIGDATAGPIDNPASNDLVIGCYNDPSQFFNGTIDEVHIYNRALSAEEINASYNAGLHKLYHNFTGLEDGTYTYTAYAQDLAGNVNQNETRTVTVDTTAPTYSLNSTNSTLAGAITAKKLKIKLSHIEAGMRSFNMRMPEEINRIITDRLSDINFVPSKLALDNLKNEGMNGILCGDIMYDAFKYYSEKAEGNNLDNIMKGIKNNEYILMTLHRASNTIPENLEIILNRLNKIGKKIIFPIHPRTLKIIKNDLKGNNQFNNIELIEPLGYIDMITLMKNSLCIITDSGGLQKEAYYAEKKCFTVRGETEWPETMMYNANILCPNAECDFITEISNTDEIKFKNPYGDGNSAEIITKYLMEYLYDN